jgi:hypothetical protein
MARCVITKDVTIGAGTYASPLKLLKKGQVVELSASEQTSVTGAGGTLRSVSALAGSASHTHDTLGEAFAVSNSSL